MFEKNGKFYADWRDRSGRRLRKSFETKRAALQYEAEQKTKAHPNERARGRQLPASSAHSSRVRATRQRGKPVSSSSPKREASHQANSQPPTSSTRTPRSPKVVTLTPQKPREPRP